MGGQSKESSRQPCGGGGVKVLLLLDVGEGCLSSQWPFKSVSPLPKFCA